MTDIKRVFRFVWTFAQRAGFEALDQGFLPQEPIDSSCLIESDNSYSESMNLVISSTLKVINFYLFFLQKQEKLINYEIQE
ncbi:hypothetical protein BpHYR1_034823 [Brachionus plicatilis]|uniref:Uncharacterized protein n=1 Tax=Brachionus plicatilis TaxID=10195 RepID=A0A3M7S8A9_BRAPC|nr:hypothetical protein BpHYR1_034823 [Brachionus plicatilis]